MARVAGRVRRSHLPGVPRAAGVVATLVIVALAVLAACASDGGDADGGGAQGRGTEPTATTASFLADPQAVEALVLARFGGTGPTMRRLTVLPSSVSVEVRDPQKPDNLDTHTYYGGQWRTDPVRVSLAEIEELDARTFTLADLDLAMVPGFMSMALEGLDLEGETVTSVSYDRLAGEDPRLYIAVDGLRGSGSLMAGADGSHPTIRRN